MAFNFSEESEPMKHSINPSAAHLVKALRFDGQVAIVTGAGGGLGRQHALALAARGAKVVVNDFSAGGSPSAAEAVAQEIRAAGGEAVANNASVTDADAMVAMANQAMARWGRIDILVNNAGILRDKSFSKMPLSDFKTVLDVHLMGSVYCTKAVWDIMKAQQYGRIVFTTSSSGLYGNFGQTNYGAAKLALVGLMQTLSLEGTKYGVNVNCLAPSAATQMTQDLLADDDLALLTPKSVTPAVVYLASKDAPTRTILCAGAGAFAAANITLTQGVFIGDVPDAPEQLRDGIDSVLDRDGEIVPPAGIEQSRIEVEKARAAL
jgi:NAD(P)-dependent dehydrogenase (short-subunit alcohol dehydrogenase family)